MAIAVEMPKMSDTMEEGVLVAWLANEGDQVSAGDIIAQVETDKATMDLEVYDDGVLLKRVVDEGAGVPIGGLIAVLGKEGEDIAELLEQYDQNGSSGKGGEREKGGKGEGKKERVEASGDTVDRSREEEQSQPVAGDGAAQEVSAPVESVPSSGGEGRVKASPLARRMAQESGIDLKNLQGTGPEGRIVKRDIQTALGNGASRSTSDRALRDKPTQPSSAPQSIPAGAEYESVPISQMRKTIARRLAQSKFTAPHFYLTIDVDMEQAALLRKKLNADAEAVGRPRISFNDLITKACAVALRTHPAVNSSWLEEEGEMRRHGEVHVAVAVAVDEGLVTPVVRHTDQKGLAQIAEETRDLATRARARKLDPSEWAGSTFTTSNLGMFGIEEFTAIINPPNACILAVGAVRDVPVVVDGAIVPGKRMKATLSCDHRIVDGATGAAFLADVKQLLEEPARMLL